MTSKPASRSARATTFAPRSCPSSPGFATKMRTLRSGVMGAREGSSAAGIPPRLGVRQAVGVRDDRPEHGRARELGAQDEPPELDRVEPGRRRGAELPGREAPLGPDQHDERLIGPPARDPIAEALAG